MTFGGGGGSHDDTNQRDYVIGEVSRQVASDETGQTVQCHACVVDVLAAQVLCTANIQCEAKGEFFYSMVLSHLVTPQRLAELVNQTHSHLSTKQYALP